MPELPEVEALAGFLRQRLVERPAAEGGAAVVAEVGVGAINVLKTFDPPPSALAGLPVTGVARHGKWLDLDLDGLHVVVHLSRAGWLRWSEQLPTTPVRPGKSPLALRVRFAIDTENDDGDGGRPGFDLTEQGTQKRLAVHVVRDPSQIPAIASLGPDPLDDSFDLAALQALLAGSRQQVKGLLREQSVLAGVGNAYSDEVLHAARISPFAVSGKLDDDEVSRLFAALKDVLRSAVAAASGKPASQLKDAKRAGMRVHGRTGETCPVCGDVVREVSFADRSLQYCATCQTGGKPLADRRTSTFLR
ncbi:formamidopyrimidine-DNA glycosylase [Quadrisphaera granulorum]|uniref:Formamidopyrimidine-DNA glycosylase n=1 Tax=Quadrisphaera granulorum TaxID=317664 RepID=A0A316AD56_9ACTN|nr:DNA-formamidopyrimidine glycosylase family protein [Quadrisphaera granulorum]PWJ55716.1 formamidopyrimidine-DNA glycosylase [Quadrisphaera granulorum]SZE95213.1 formamidopyrimidine-DNA glycosylase [Quadrisphaera granulorum]